MASVSGAQTSRTLLDILPQFARSKIEVGSVRLKPILGVTNIQSSSSRFPKLEECAHFHYDHVDLPPMQLTVVEEGASRGDFEGVTLEVKSGNDVWQVHRTYAHFCKLDEQLHQCVFDRKFSQLPVLKNCGPKTQEEIRKVLSNYVRRLSAIGSGCAISCGPALTWFELDNRGRRLVGAGNGINTPAVAAAFATTTYTAHANDELSFQTGDMISVIDMPPAEESAWWRGKRGFVVGFFPSNCVAVITDKIPNEIALVGPTKPVLRKHGKLIAFFRAFILSRPSRRRLKQSGILRERVFGCDLSEHLLNSGRDIPLVLKCCAEFIEAHGIVDGIYRLSGVTSNIQRLRSTFDEDRIPVLTEDSGIRQDIHSVASLLKMYFRELPNPLCTYQLYDEFVAAVQSPPDVRLDNMRRVVQKLPPPHYRTLEYLMGHLGRVCGHSRGTGMTARNVAIVWAPNLLRCKSLDQGVAALQGVGVQAVVTEFLILYAPHIFGHQPGEGIRARPKSLAVCTPTKLLPLHEAQMREQQSPTRSENRTTQVPTCYHTVLELPRKRQTLTWRAIFTPLRSTQGKSTHRIKHKNVVKSAEFLGIAKVVTLAPQGSMPSSSTHSRSVSHDSYFDTVLEQPSTSSLIDTQHEGLSLSLDLSELQMNFELEESEMKIFSEDETNQLFSSGTSIAFGALDTESNLEQRFSNQELRYIDSYSPDPMESPSEDPLTPGYQPLVSPNSYENLKVNSDARNTEESGTSSKKSDTSPCPYPYKELSDSSNNVEDMQRKENDLYESCPENNNTVKNSIYESMEPEQEMYEPIMVATDTTNQNVYQNEEISSDRKSEAEESNIYEDVQLSPSEIYEQVSYLKCSVEEVNRLVEETRSESTEPDEAIIQNSFSSTSQGPTTGILGDDDLSSEIYENVGEEHDLEVKKNYSVYDKVESVMSQESSTRQELCSKQCMAAVNSENPSSDIDPLETPKDDNRSASINDAINLVIEENIDDLKTPIKLKDTYEKNAKVPELYECVDFEPNKVEDSFCETEYERVNFSTGMIVCENKCEEDKKSDIKNVDEPIEEKPKKMDTETVCDTLVSDKKEEKHSAEQRPVLKADPAQIPEWKDYNIVEKRNSTSSTPAKVPCTVVSGLLKEDCPVISREKLERKALSLDLRPDYNEREVSGKTEKLRLLFEREMQIAKAETDEGNSKAEMSGAQEEIKKTERKLSIEESEAERRERIEKYKEERRSFFRNKYKTDNINNNDDDDELIRRIKQKTKLKEQRDTEAEIVVLRRRSVDKDEELKRSPSKTTVTISYSPTRTKISGDWTPASQEKKGDSQSGEAKSKLDKSQTDGTH